MTALTATERRVAELALRGLSNREIAADLGLAPKTIEGHLYRVYRKLRIAGRDELPATLGPDVPLTSDANSCNRGAERGEGS
jgi:DNA-binding CsgD family transcriptional regulator